MSHALTLVFGILAGGLGVLLTYKRQRPARRLQPGPEVAQCPNCGHWHGLLCVDHRRERQAAAK